MSSVEEEEHGGAKDQIEALLNASVGKVAKASAAAGARPAVVALGR